MKNNNSNYPLGDSENQDSKERRAFKAFKGIPKTMMTVEKATGIRRDSFICWRMSEWLEQGSAALVYYGVCPETKSGNVGFYTTDKKQFPISKPTKK